MDLFGALKGIVGSLGYGADVNAFLEVFGLAFARIATAVSLAPFLGGRAVSSTVKMGMAAMLTLLLMPGLTAGARKIEAGPLLFLALLLKEAAVGLTIGILTQLIFNGVEMAGALVDTARGLDQPGLFTPQLESNASATAQLKVQLALVLFLATGGHLIFIRSLAASFERVPLRGFAHFDGAGGAERAAALSAQVFAIALQLAAPVLAALFLVDICFAALAKVAPQMNAYSESQPVKSMVGLGVFVLAFGAIVIRLQGAIGGFLRDAFSFIAGLG